MCFLASSSLRYDFLSTVERLLRKHLFVSRPRTFSEFFTTSGKVFRIFYVLTIFSTATAIIPLALSFTAPFTYRLTVVIVRHHCCPSNPSTVRYYIIISHQQLIFFFYFINLTCSDPTSFDYFK